MAYRVTSLAALQQQVCLCVLKTTSVIGFGTALADIQNAAVHQ